MSESKGRKGVLRGMEQRLKAQQEEIGALRRAQEEQKQASEQEVEEEDEKELQPEDLEEEEKQGQGRSKRRHQIKLEAKLPLPPTYEGTNKTSVETWLFELQQYFEVAELSSEQRVSWAASLLREGAANWWSSVVQQKRKELGVEPDDAEAFRSSDMFSWSEFQKLCRERFAPVEAARTARAVLMTLHQLKFTGIEPYNQAFQRQLSLITDMSVTDQIMYYQRGLKPEVARDLNIANPKTLIEAMGIASRSSASWATKMQATSASSTSHPASQSFEDGTGEVNSMSTGESLASLPSSRTYLGYGTSSSHMPASSVLNYIGGYTGRGGGGSYRRGGYANSRRADLERLQAENRCFRCRQQGHLARDCPNGPADSYGRRSSSSFGRGRDGRFQPYPSPYYGRWRGRGMGRELNTRARGY